MFLKSIELYGFKSFADRTRFEFPSGVTSLLGPNGSGKSNVVDAIKWVLGTGALSALRAGKKEDVIFNGTETRHPMPMCEVILTLNNEEGRLNISASEVELKRRMFRTGENEYYINREKVLLKNVKDLFLDTGVGKSAYSILEQGKIDGILSLKPEDRRYLFEEAAGISRFKQQSEDAAKKLEKTDANLAQVEVIYREQEKTLNSRRSQLDKVLKSRELTARKETLEIDLQLSYVQALNKLYGVREEELKEKEADFNEIEDFLSEKRTGLYEQREELEGLRAERENLNSSISRTDEQIHSLRREEELQRERYTELHQRSKDAAFKAEQSREKLKNSRQNIEDKKNLREALKDNVETLKVSIDKLIAEIEDEKRLQEKYKTEIETIKERNNALYRDRAQITEKISALANSIADKLQQDIKGSSYSKALRSNAEKNFFNELKKTETVLRERVSLLKKIAGVDFEKDVFLNAIEEAEESLQAELYELKGLFQEYNGTIPDFLDDFTDPEGFLSRRTGLDAALRKSYTEEEENNEKIKNFEAEIERLSRSLILKESDLNDLKLELREHSTKIESLSNQITDLEELLRQMTLESEDAEESAKIEKQRESDVLEAIENLKKREEDLHSEIEEKRNSLAELELKIDTKSGEISRENSVFQEKFEKKQRLMTELATSRANLQALDDNIQKVYRDFFDETGKSLKEFDKEEITVPVDDLKAELETVKKKIQDLGYINYMAEDEYNEAKKNFDFYQKNLDDLTTAKNDLTFIIEEIKTRSEEMFIATFNQINESFEEMFKTLFGGGRARLILTDEEDVLHSGIEIEAEPPGKKMTYLPSLSGGEKSMTAVALLFATYKVKPSPFCVLDEIDAALDAKNIGSFMKVLEKFENESQFIIITHNKGTALGSDTLLGVTQEEAGVSKAIGYKIDGVEKESLKGADTLKG